MIKIKDFFKKNRASALGVALVLFLSGILFLLSFAVFSRYHKSDKDFYRVGLVLDIHSQRSKKNSYDISDSLKNFFQYAGNDFKKEFRPDVLVQNGDFIEGTEREGQKSIDDFLKAKEYLDKMDIPVLHAMGNHEARGFSKDDWLKITANEKAYYNFDLGKMRIIVLDGNEETPKSKEIGGNYYYMSEEQIKWLEKTLNESETFRYKLVFIHFPVLKSQIVPSDKNIDHDDMKKLHELFGKHGVDAVFSGHAEILRFEESEGTKYFILPGIEKSKRRKVQWFDCFYEIYVEEEIKVKMFYKKDSKQEKYETLIIPSEEFDRIEK
jgi:3',5'-cyclic AMP phosphodiesterase CpdA